MEWFFIRAHKLTYCNLHALWGLFLSSSPPPLLLMFLLFPIASFSCLLVFVCSTLWSHCLQVHEHDPCLGNVSCIQAILLLNLLFLSDCLLDLLSSWLLVFLTPCLLVFKDSCQEELLASSSGSGHLYAALWRRFWFTFKALRLSRCAFIQTSASGCEEECLRETLRKSGRCIDALKKRRRALKMRGRVLRKKGRVLKKRGILRRGGGFLRSFVYQKFRKGVGGQRGLARGNPWELWGSFWGGLFVANPLPPTPFRNFWCLVGRRGGGPLLQRGGGFLRRGEGSQDPCARGRVASRATLCH